MDEIIREILDRFRVAGGTAEADDKLLDGVLRAHNRHIVDNSLHYSKKKLTPYFLAVKESDPGLWASWNMDSELERRLTRALRLKPRRTSSGVATITVITKPWPCSGSCIYCPNDLTMPKSYLRDEPACLRAERNFFDPYLQVTSRLKTLMQMGHVTDKVELIVLGGTWSDYPFEYQTWFMAELFRALNEGGRVQQHEDERRQFYEACGLSDDRDTLSAFVRNRQREVADGALTYNQAWAQLYGTSDAWSGVAARQVATLDDLAEQQAANENAQHRVVGLVVETRPDLISAQSLMRLRRFGCTKVQIGIQSLDEDILRMNGRNIGLDTIRESLELLRVFGFKTHVHFMVNLYGSTPAADKDDYLRLVRQPAYEPDEVKLYPCVLIDDTGLCARFADGTWKPYDEDTLVDVLVSDTLSTPPYMRISRMMRDFSACDISAGSRKMNLRQMVESQIARTGVRVDEIRYREINTDEVDTTNLALEDVRYTTTATEEHFLQWVTPEGRIAGFLRLSLPDEAYVRQHADELPVAPYEAMIREVHVYGTAVGLHETGEGVQHLGLGRQLIERACDIARAGGYKRMNVISAVGTREYYRGLGFADSGLYQQMQL